MKSEINGVTKYLCLKFFHINLRGMLFLNILMKSFISFFFLQFENLIMIAKYNLEGIICVSCILKVQLENV